GGEGFRAAAAGGEKGSCAPGPAPLLVRGWHRGMRSATHDRRAAVTAGLRAAVTPRPVGAIYTPNLPAITTGPVGLSLNGDPPAGSSETANPASRLGSPASGISRIARPFASGLITPRLATPAPRSAQS